MLADIIEARPLEPYWLFARFEDGVEGTIDLRDLVPFEGVFAPLKDPDEFRKLAVNADLGTVSWACGADLDPVIIYARLTGGEITSNHARMGVHIRQ